MGKYIIAGISLALALVTGQNFLIWASLCSCLLLFVFPLMLLGTVSPSLVKYTVSSLDESGKTVGELNALNTIGSIIGTFTPTFLTIPAVGTARTFVIFAGILLIISLMYFVSERRKWIRCATAVVLTAIFAAASSFSSFAFWKQDSNLYEDESVYNYLQVTENEKEINLSTNVLFGVQSVTRKDGKLSHTYYDYALAALLMAGAAQKEELSVLILGFGSGTYAMECRRYFPQSRVDGVEIDRKILELAVSRFGMDPNDSRIHTVVFDGRAYLRGAGQYDVIMADAYRDITIPFQLSSREFFTEVRQHLTSDGVMVLNLNMISDQEDSLNAYLCDTAAAVFPGVWTADVGGNREVFAGERTAAERFCADYPTAENDLAVFMRKVSEELQPYKAGNRILTDDKAPVELLGMRVIDELIAEELSSYREMFRGKSLSQMLALLG